MAHESVSTTQYLAEIFAPRCTRDRLRAESLRVRAAAEALADSGEPVRYLHSLLVPGEEIAFHFFEAEQPEAVAHALHGAGLEAERISLAIPNGPR